MLCHIREPNSGRFYSRTNPSIKPSHSITENKLKEKLPTRRKNVHKLEENV